MADDTKLNRDPDLHQKALVIHVPGYIHITWADVDEGAEVFLQGHAGGTPHAYGPHTVVSRDYKILANSRREQFMHYAEDLIVPES